MRYIGIPCLFKALYEAPVKPNGIRAHLWHLLPKPIAQLQRDNGSYQDGS
jgi:hypothetical protein